MSEEVEARLEAKDVIGAYALLPPWYRPFTSRTPVPSREALEATRTTYSNLFSQDDIPPGLLFTFKYDGDTMEDSVPSEEEIHSALFKMRSRKAPGLTTIRVDHPKEWYKLSHLERRDQAVDTEAARKWTLVVKIIRECFESGTAPIAFRYGTLVIIPKDDKGGVRGIGLLEVVHKLMSTIINLRMTAAINFCLAVHGFCQHRGCYTAIGKAKIRMQRAAYAGVTMYQIYLDLRKAYDSINRESVLALLQRYGVGPNVRRYISFIWEDQIFLLKQSGFFSDPISVDRRVTQGDTDSPIIFNVIIDAVLHRAQGEAAYGGSDQSFYADDGLLKNSDHRALQRDVDRMVELFALFGLRANHGKTKYMVLRGPTVPNAQSTEVYASTRAGGMSQKEWGRQDVECPFPEC